MTTRRKLLYTLIGLSIVLACNDHGLIPLDRAISVVVIEDTEVGPTDQIDILWVIDNSNSMCQEQDALTTNFATFIEGLAEINADFNMAVVTTDMSESGDRGRFNDRPGPIGPECSGDVAPLSCTPRQDPVLHSSDYLIDDATGQIDVARLQEDFRCIATVGTVSGGAGFERGLDAMRAALSADLLDSANAGFRRPGAWLAIFFLTDENDCSHGGALDLVDANDCEYLRDDLIPVQSFINQISSLEGTEDGDRVLVAGIIGPDNGRRPVRPETPQPSCSGPRGTAFAGYRYEEFISAFGERGVQADICNDSFSVALDQIARVIQANLAVKCLQRPVPTCVDDFDCADGAICEDPDGPGVGTDTTYCSNVTFTVEVQRADGTVDELVPEVVEGDGGDFTVNYAAACPRSGGVGIEFIGPNQPLPGDTYVVRYPSRIQLDGQGGGSTDAGADDADAAGSGATVE